MNPIPRKQIPATKLLPRHVAIIMDGNGRWAEQRRLPRFAGHKSGAEAVRLIVETCAEKGIEVLTVFAFSSENWQRPEEEVGMLMGLFMTTLEQQVKRLHVNNVRFRLVGERSAFNKKLQRRIHEAELLTRDNTGLNLVIAANYGGRWDISQAARRIAEKVEAGELHAREVTTDLFASLVSLHAFPEPDLFIRTGGEKRISNFLLWQLAYTELYFTDTLWPDFDNAAMNDALEAFALRQRRYGRTGQQVLSAAET